DGNAGQAARDGHGQDVGVDRCLVWRGDCDTVRGDDRAAALDRCLDGAAGRVGGRRTSTGKPEARGGDTHADRRGHRRRGDARGGVGRHRHVAGGGGHVGGVDGGDDLVGDRVGGQRGADAERRRGQIRTTRDRDGGGGGGGGDGGRVLRLHPDRPAGLDALAGAAGAAAALDAGLGGVVDVVGGAGAGAGQRNAHFPRGDRNGRAHRHGLDRRRLGGAEMDVAGGVHGGT